MTTEKELIEKRNGPDRRKRKIPPLRYLLFGGRRKAIRRKEDEQRLVILDTHGPGIFALAILILILSITDGFFTLHLMASGAREMNPLMAYLIDLNPYAYFFIKCILIIIGLIFLIILKNYRSKLFGVHLSKLFPAIALVFIAVIFYQLYLSSL